MRMDTSLQVDGVLWDLDRVLEGDCSLQLLKFEDEEGWAHRGPDELDCTLLSSPPSLLLFLPPSFPPLPLPLPPSLSPSSTPSLLPFPLPSLPRLLPPPLPLLPPTEGVIQVSDPALLDREAMPVFNLLLIAQDRSPFPRASNTSIRIVLSDVNDNPPVFEQLLYRTEITEVGECVLRNITR